MKIVAMILKIVFHFGSFEAGEFEQLSMDANAWWNRILIDLKKTLKENINEYATAEVPKWQIILKYYAEQWYLKVLFVFIYIWAVREIKMFMNPDLKQVDDDEDDE